MSNPIFPMTWNGNSAFPEEEIPFEPLDKRINIQPMKEPIGIPIPKLVGHYHSEKLPAGRLYRHGEKPAPRKVVVEKKEDSNIKHIVWSSVNHGTHVPVAKTKGFEVKPP